MVERCILHIGGPKTGTTSLQWQLDQADLKGLHYPKVLRGSGEDRFGHHRLSVDPDSGNYVEIRRDLFRGLQTDAPVVFWSSESLFPYEDAPARSLRAVARFLASLAPLEIYMTVRDPDHWALSWAQQLAMIGAINDFADWAASFNLQTAALNLSDVASSLGAEVKIFRYAPDINDQIGSSAGLVQRLPVVRAGTTPHLDQQGWQLILRLSRLVPDSSRYEAMVRAAGAISACGTRGRPLRAEEVFPRSLASRFIDDFRRAAETLAQGGIDASLVSECADSAQGRLSNQLETTTLETQALRVNWPKVMEEVARLLCLSDPQH